MQTKFIHLRHVKAVAGLQARGGLTIAYREAAMPNGTKSISLATARCSRRDVYNKKIGRAVSEGRLNTLRNGSQVLTMTLPEDHSTIQALTEAFGKKDLQLL